MAEIKLSPLTHTWLIDLDGTIIKHNGYMEGKDIVLPGVINFWKNISDKDTIILLTARSGSSIDQAKIFLKDNVLRYDHIIHNLPTGERILVNDIKPGGLKTAISINIPRDEGLIGYEFNVDHEL